MFLAIRREIRDVFEEETRMEIRDFLSSIASNYDRHATMGTAAQQRLRHAADYLSAHVPAGIIVRGGGGQTTPTETPFVAFLDPDETTRPGDGVYAVYLFAADLATVFLSLNQGITVLTERMGAAAARRRLRADASAIRNHLPPDALSGLESQINLKSQGDRQRSYETGNIAAFGYQTSSLPSESSLQAELGRMFGLYQLAVATKRVLLQAVPGSIATASILQQGEQDDPLKNFRPKDESDYLAHLAGRELTKSRRHETVVRQFGELASANGFVPSTAEHPRDLVLRRDSEEWLVEVKVVYQGNATTAVRAALGQLYAYRYFHYGEGEAPHLVAVFSESVGGAYVDFLEACGIASVWKGEDAWKASPMGKSAGLT